MFFFKIPRMSSNILENFDFKIHQMLRLLLSKSIHTAHSAYQRTYPSIGFLPCSCSSAFRRGWGEDNQKFVPTYSWARQLGPRRAAGTVTSVVNMRIMSAQTPSTQKSNVTNTVPYVKTSLKGKSWEDERTTRSQNCDNAEFGKTHAWLFEKL